MKKMKVVHECFGNPTWNQEKSVKVEKKFSVPKEIDLDKPGVRVLCKDCGGVIYQFSTDFDMNINFQIHELEQSIAKPVRV